MATYCVTICLTIVNYFNIYNVNVKFYSNTKIKTRINMIFFAKIEIKIY